MKPYKKRPAPVKHAPPIKKKTWWSRFGYPVIIAVAAFTLYVNTINHNYVLDDNGTITANKIVQGGIKSIPEIMSSSYRFGMNGQYNDVLYRPLSLVLFAMEWQIKPASPLFNHTVNILLFVLTSVILFYVLKRILASYYIAIPFIITLLWVVHPIHTEVVANIKSCDEILAFLFSILAIRQAILYSSKGKLQQLILLSFLFMLALLSKENAVSLLLIIPATLYFFTGFSREKFIWICLSLVLVLFVYLAIRFSVISQSAVANIDVNDNVIAGAKNISERFGTVFFILGYYLYKLFLPLNFSCDYSFNQIPLRGMGDFLSIISLLIYVFLLVFTILRFRKKDVLAYGILFYLFAIITVSNLFILIGSTMAERFLFAPSLGFCIAFVFLLFRLFKINIALEPTRFISFKKFPQAWLLLVLFFGVIIFYSVKTVGRNAEWSNNLSLFTADLKTAPNNSKLKFYYATEIIQEIKNGAITGKQAQDYFKEGDKQLAVAIKIDPGYGLLYNTLGLYKNLENKYDEAKIAFKKAYSLYPKDFNVNNNLGNCYFRLQQYDSAIYFINKAIKYDPYGYNAYNGLAGCYFLKGDYENAVKNYLKSISLNDNNAMAYKNLGATYFAMKRYDDALTTYKTALRITPDDRDILKQIETVKAAIKD